MSLEILYPIPDFIIDSGSFLLPAVDSSGFWKFEPGSVKDLNTMTKYYMVYVVNGKVKINPKHYNKINFNGEVKQMI